VACSLPRGRLHERWLSVTRTTYRTVTFAREADYIVRRVRSVNRYFLLPTQAIFSQVVMRKNRRAQVRLCHARESASHAEGARKLLLQPKSRRRERRFVIQQTRRRLAMVTPLRASDSPAALHGSMHKPCARSQSCRIAEPAGYSCHARNCDQTRKKRMGWVRR
jgi:hypothetical protein